MRGYPQDSARAGEHLWRNRCCRWLSALCPPRWTSPEAGPRAALAARFGLGRAHLAPRRIGHGAALPAGIGGCALPRQAGGHANLRAPVRENRPQSRRLESQRSTAKVADKIVLSSGHRRRCGLNWKQVCNTPTSFMSPPAPAKISVVVITLLLAMPLSAQRYQGRDHHVFHPPVQTKHQSPASAASTTQTRVSSPGNPSSSQRHEPSLNASHGNEPARTQMPPVTDSVHPH